jgi:nicotinate-nucleotide adenylyltransferase
MRIGVFGGTFDPVHLAHLILAEQCREQGHLDQVWFIPAARPPHKLDRPVTPFHQRVEMLQLAIAGNAAFRVDELESERSGVSYTADTLATLKQRAPENDFHFIVGSDCLPDLTHWHDPARIVAVAGLMIVNREGWPVWPAERLRDALGVPSEVHIRQEVVQMPAVSISSSDLRCRASEGRSLRYLVPRAVECYIETHHLYGRGATAAT